MVKQMNKCLSGLLPCIRYSAGAVDKSYFDSDSAGRGFEPHHIRTLDTGRVCSSVVEQHMLFSFVALVDFFVCLNGDFEGLSGWHGLKSF